MYILIDLSAKRLFLKEGEEILGDFPIGIGRYGAPTPIGMFQIIEKVSNPKEVYSNGEIYGAGCLNLDLWVDGRPYAIHGTDDPSSIGAAKSAGCVRLHNDDFEQLFKAATREMQVIITISPV